MQCYYCTLLLVFKMTSYMLDDFFNALWEITPLLWSHVLELLLLEQQELIRPALSTFVLISDSQGAIHGTTCLDMNFDFDE